MAQAKLYKEKVSAISKQMNQIHQRTKNLKVGSSFLFQSDNNNNNVFSEKSFKHPSSQREGDGLKTLIMWFNFEQLSFG